MARYIDADKFEQTIKGKELFQGYFDNGFIYDELHRQPTPDVVEVVRCEKCKFVHFNSDSCRYHCKRRGYYSEEVKTTDFCSYGERRDT